ncbi:MULTISPECIES: ABC transporter permease [Chelatococcus]|uniref:Peptide/nickel transport system permease protein n=1 Tax=Chelatococcus caeni TaxID=1348468 RepID=A0A840BUR0_9HYPH|nr:MULTISPECIES: ABC transporter permease [Chelatococcus]ALA19328.1 peptide ABC transporter permease [Chelatococcus sp. CO-6]MBB4016664.1 peptide/nickel transport system permease protein [Chelatococcus caeni]
MSATMAAGRRSLAARALGHPSFLLGAAISLVVAAMALLSFVWTPHDPTVLDIARKLQPPSATHWLGTDQYGRDVLSMIMHGAVTSMAVSFVAVGIGLGLGVPLGLLAAARRGLVGEAVMRANDFVFAFPALIIAIMLRDIFGPGAINAMVAIGIFNVPVFARLAYGAALPLWTREFVMAARVAGKGGGLITLEHILPNMLSLVIVQATIQLSLGVLAEAALSYVGLGVQPPAPSWGRMLNEAQTLMALAPRLALVPGLAIVVTVMGLNLLGDGLRDLLDPRLARER